MFARIALSLFLVALPMSVFADDPPKEEKLPAPRQVKEVPGFGQMRINRYAVWQYYDVDRFGRFRPVVIYSPSGAYYLATGECFPWTSTHPQEFLRKIVD